MKYLILISFALSFNISIGQNRSICLTFDDLLATPADSEDYDYITSNLLKTLTSNEIEAIGFVNEQRLYTDNKPDSTKIKILEKWPKANMDLGNHTFSHVYINNTSIEDYKKDVLRGEEITRPLLKKYNEELKYFRHPQLRTGPTDEYRNKLSSFLDANGYTVAPVTIDNDEYIYAYCYARAKEQGKNELMQKIGDDYLMYMQEILTYYEDLSKDFLGYELPQILLLHANNLNADYLDELIEILKNRSYSFTSIDQVLKDKAYSFPEGTHSRGPSWIQRWMIEKGMEPGSHPDVSDFIRNLYNSY